MSREPPKILFVSPPVTYPKATVEEDNVDVFYYRNTLGQGLFQLRQWHSWHPLHFLAQNLPVPSVVLESPTERAFREEVRRGDYQIVAITFTVILARSVLDMVTWLRATSPEIEIVLGGYGSVIFDEELGIEREISAKVDLICRGEGLAGLRAYLAERWGVSGLAPLRQALVPTRNSFFRTRLTIYQQLAFVSALGCANGCPFCATSGHYGRAKIPIASGRQLYEQLRAGAARHPRVQSAIIYDENFLEDRDRVAELTRCLAADRALRERPFLLTVFSSVRTISQYSVAELVRCNIGTIFVGVESFRRDILDDEALDKRGGENVTDLFTRLHDAGINTLGSMIVGWDAHTPDNVQAELDAFVALNPTFYQIVPLHPVPGTPLWRRVKEQGRLVAGYRYEDDGVARSNFVFKHFADEAVQRLVLGTYRRLVEVGGPWPFRLLENLARGARNLERSADPALVERGHAYRKMMRPLLPLALASGVLFGGADFRARWRAAMSALWSEAPGQLVGAALLGLVELPALALLYLFGALRHHLSARGDQPESLRVEYAPAAPAQEPPDE